MSVDFTLNANARNDQGKGASRRLRRLENLVPAIVYGGNKTPQSIAILQKDLAKALENEAFYAHVISLNIDGKKEDVLLKDLQRHPSKQALLHADFLRVDKHAAVVLRVPLHFINENICVGIKSGGGVINHSMSDLEIRCLPSDLPEFIEVDMAQVGLNEVIHISNIKLPKGVESIQLSHGTDHDLPVAAVHALKGSSSTDETTEEEIEEEKKD